MRELSERSGWLLVAFVAIAAHASALPGGYIWLDHAHVEEGLALAKPDDWLALFQRGFAGTGFYRPLMALSLSVDALISKTPGFFRAVTASWHALAAVMTLVAGRSLGLSRRAALLAGLLFAVHPISSLAANAIAFRSEAMIVVALLTLVVAHLNQNAVVAGLAVLAGALTKETAMVLAPLFVLALEVDRRKPRGGSSPDRRPRARRVLGFEGAALLVALGLHWLYAPSWRAAFQDSSIGDAVGTRLAAFAKSSGALLVPFDNTICDAFPISSLVSPIAALGAALLVGAIYLAWKGRAPAWLLLLALLPSLNLVPLSRFWSPHYLYVAAAFGAMLLAQLADRRGKSACAAILAASVILGALSFTLGYRYRDDIALWTPEVSATPECREGHFYLAEAAREKGDWDAAALSYERAIAPTPGYLAYADFGAALQDLGAVRLQQHDWSRAKDAFSAALEHVNDPLEERQILHNLAALALQSGNAAEAARLLEPETARSDALPESLFIRARALHELGREREAEDLIRRIQRQHPEH